MQAVCNVARLRRVVVAGLLTAILSGCGGSTEPGDVVVDRDAQSLNVSGSVLGFDSTMGGRVIIERLALGCGEVLDSRGSVLAVTPAGTYSGVLSVWPSSAKPMWCVRAEYNGFHGAHAVALKDSVTFTNFGHASEVRLDVQIPTP